MFRVQCFEENQFRFCFRLRSSVFRRCLLSLAKLRLEEVWKSFTEHTEREMFGSRTTVKKVRDLLSWFSQDSDSSIEILSPTQLRNMKSAATSELDPCPFFYDVDELP